MTLAPGACTKNHAKVHSLPLRETRRHYAEYNDYVEAGKPGGKKGGRA